MLKTQIANIRNDRGNMTGLYKKISDNKGILWTFISILDEISIL